MQIGMIGLGRMGSSMVNRLLRCGHDCVVHDHAPEGIERLVALGAMAATSVQQFVVLMVHNGSVIGSWLLDLTATALAAAPSLAGDEGRISDSGDGRWTVQAAIDEGVPAPVLSEALYARFDSRGDADFANRVQSAMRHEFGGHVENPVDGNPTGT